MINLDKIETFRYEVNYDKFVFVKYKDVNGKNQWGCICSAMDWITVAAEYLMKFNVKKRNIQSMEMFSYIASIDVIWEAVKQLYRVIVPESKGKILDKEFECFHNRVYKDKDDNAYFKEIRACFGAHPVNLKDDQGERLFAGWSGAFSGGDYSVLLYSSTPKKPFRKMVISFDELNAFLEKRYSLLDELQSKIKLQRSEFVAEKKKIKIPKVEDHLEQLKILKREVAERGQDDYFECTVNELIMIFRTSIKNEKNLEFVTRYQERLIPLIDELYVCLQEMNFGELENDTLDYLPDSLPAGYGYYLEKLSEYINGSGYHPTVWESELRKIFDGKFIMEYDSYEELQVLITANMSEME